MEIIHHCNSFISVKINNTSLICDPWVGFTNDNGWLSYPIFQKGDQILKKLNPDFIYISHLHCDHFDTKTLKSCNKNVKIIIKKFNDERLKQKIEKIGFNNIFECVPWKKIKLNKDLSISIIPQISNNSDNLESDINYDLDTSIIIQSNITKKIFFNSVDNPLNIYHYRKINKFVKRVFFSKIHTICMPVGSASEYPHCFLNINRNKEKIRVKNQILNQVKNKLKIIKPKVFFPAGGNYILYGKYSNLDKFITTPNFNEISKKIKFKNLNIFNLNYRKLIINQNNIEIKNIKSKFQKVSREFLKSQFSKSKYQYQKHKSKISLKKLDLIYNLSVENYFNRLKKIKIDTSWKVKFYLYKNLTLNKNSKIKNIKHNLVKTYVLNYNNLNSKSSTFLECYLDIDLFSAMLRRIHPWNVVLSGSLVLFKRYPNKFDPNVPFSLNYLAI